MPAEDQSGAAPSGSVRERRVFAAEDRPDVEVLWESQWCPGELRMWVPVGESGWEAQVSYRRPGETSSHLGTFPASEVRLDQVDRSYGRTAPGADAER